ncbi:unnamed protein product [Brachionus calyciflorus]|uniref:Uncharacterized protein n=1 Tax=Brachionus calyciflorus TaxID=104777 RepID=A0A813UNL2_9BILA|nr:unnamed protein product [Brachionus calyciflorus]
MDNPYVTYHPYYGYQADPKKNSQFLSFFSHIPFFSPEISKETKGLIGFIIFVIFLILLTVAGIIGLLFIGNFFRKVDKINNADFSFDVQNAFKLQSSQLFDILTTAESNRTQNQNNTLEVEKIFFETKLNEILKPKLNEKFAKVYNLRLIPSSESGLIDVAYSIKTQVIPRNLMKTFKENIEKVLSTSNIYDDVNIGSDISILTESSKPLISDGIEGDILLKEKNFLSISQTKIQVLAQRDQLKSNHHREVTYFSEFEEKFQPEIFVNHELDIQNEYTNQHDVFYQTPNYEFATEPLIENWLEFSTKSTESKGKYESEKLDNSHEKDFKLKNSKELNVISTTSTTKKLKKIRKTKTTKSTDNEDSSLISSEIESDMNHTKISSIKTTALPKTTSNSTLQLSKVKLKNPSNSTFGNGRFKSLDEYLMKIIKESTVKNQERNFLHENKFNLKKKAYKSIK